MYKILIPKALKESARTFLTDKGYELVELQGTDEETMKKAISDVDAVIARADLVGDGVCGGDQLGAFAGR